MVDGFLTKEEVATVAATFKDLQAIRPAFARARRADGKVHSLAYRGGPTGGGQKNNESTHTIERIEQRTRIKQHGLEGLRRIETEHTF